jgi:hypothetical protein
MEMDQRVEHVSYARVEVNKGCSRTGTTEFGMNAVRVLYVRNVTTTNKRRPTEGIPETTSSSTIRILTATVCRVSTPLKNSLVGVTLFEFLSEMVGILPFTSSRFTKIEVGVCWSLLPLSCPFHYFKAGDGLHPCRRVVYILQNMVSLVKGGWRCRGGFLLRTDAAAR